MAMVTYLFFIFHYRAAAMTLRTVLLSLQALLAAAEPDDPQDAVVARQYKENYELYVSTAKFWCFFHAGGKFHHQIIFSYLTLFHDYLFAATSKSNSDFSAKVKQLKDMGVSDIQALVALSSCNWEMVQAIEQLFS